MALHDGERTDRLRANDPWSVALVTDLWDESVAGFPAGGGYAGSDIPADRGHTAVLETQADARFPELLRHDRRFAFPAVAMATVWFLLYMLGAVTAPALMAYPVLGVVTAAMTAALAQFITTSQLTWAYARTWTAAPGSDGPRTPLLHGYPDRSS